MGVPQSKEIAHGEEYAKNVMFLCNHNSCRSQMADGWMRHLRGDASVGCASAGIVGGTAVKPGAITARARRREPFFSRNGPSARRANEIRETTENERFGAARARRVMKEVGVDISDFTSDAVADYDPADFDIVISCCGCGKKLDPEDKIAWKKREAFYDWALDDPPAIDPGDLSEYRRVRDEVKAKCIELLEKIESDELGNRENEGGCYGCLA
ncbi:low molecular weight phosphatase [Aureococcus anophagefferens]|uniref:Low molecular weight phosphatase n=1 Tax=Aureococcus anophagefferens TaxID=44056 RepID=A0ABR1FWN8_AURAN|nr:Low molecular weight phosphatase [Aureococcus anophagefferens]